MEYLTTRRDFLKGALAGAAYLLLRNSMNAAEQSGIQEAQAGLSYNSEELKELSDTLFAEAANQKSEARRGIARVVVNRAKNPRFPNSLFGVLRQENAFSCRLGDGSKNWRKATGELPMTDYEKRVYDECYTDAQWVLDGGSLNAPREGEAEAYHDSSVSIKTLRVREHYWRTLAPVFREGNLIFYAKAKANYKKKKRKR